MCYEVVYHEARHRKKVCGYSTVELLDHADAEIYEWSWQSDEGRRWSGVFLAHWVDIQALLNTLVLLPNLAPPDTVTPYYINFEDFRYLGKATHFPAERLQELMTAGGTLTGLNPLEVYLHLQISPYTTDSQLDELIYAGVIARKYTRR
jgi:hypothetical protein